jgi:hypothetical protein
MIYDHAKDESNGRDSALIAWVWANRDAGAICDAEVHLYLGRYFGYPLCCIEAFIFEAFEGNQWQKGGLATDRLLGTYYHCHKCYEERKVKNEIQG